MIVKEGLNSPGIDSEESIPPAYVAWRARTTNRVVVSVRQAGNGFLGSLKCLQIRATLLLRERNAVSLYRSLRTKYGDLLIERDSLRYQNYACNSRFYEVRTVSTVPANRILGSIKFQNTASGRHINYIQSPYL